MPCPPSVHCPSPTLGESMSGRFRGLTIPGGHDVPQDRLRWAVKPQDARSTREWQRPAQHRVPSDDHLRRVERLRLPEQRDPAGFVGKLVEQRPLTVGSSGREPFRVGADSRDTYGCERSVRRCGVGGELPYSRERGKSCVCALWERGSLSTFGRQLIRHSSAVGRKPTIAHAHSVGSIVCRTRTGVRIRDRSTNSRATIPQ